MPTKHTCNFNMFTLRTVDRDDLITRLSVKEVKYLLYYILKLVFDKNKPKLTYKVTKNAVQE